LWSRHHELSLSVIADFPDDLKFRWEAKR
jgi:hypothetical protein